MSINNILNTTKINKLWSFDQPNTINLVTKTSIDISHKLQNATPEIREPLDFRKIKNISKAGSQLQRHLESESNKQHIVIGGSGAVEAQVKYHRDPKDLDIHVRNIRKEAQHIAKILRKVYGQKNIKVNPMLTFPDRTKMIQIKLFKNGQWIDAADIKSIVRPGTLLPSVGVRTKVPLKIGKLRYDPIGELISRKASAINQNYTTPIKSGKPPLKRARKDIRDFRAQVRSTQRVKSNPRVKKQLSQFERGLSQINLSIPSNLWTL